MLHCTSCNACLLINTCVHNKETNKEMSNLNSLSNPLEFYTHYESFARYSETPFLYMCTLL